jgi:hypothetical protein
MADFDLLEMGESVEIDWETLYQIFDGEIEVSTSTEDANEEMERVLNPIKTEETLLQAPDKKRFKTVSDTELQELQERRQSKATKFNTKWGIKLFQGKFMFLNNNNF